MKENRIRTLNITYNASGALQAAQRGDVVVIVDIIDMSTTAEAVLDAGAQRVLGASPDNLNPPVPVNPQKIGYRAGKLAGEDNEVIIIAEPRFALAEKRLKRVQSVRQGLKQAGVEIGDIVPNIGTQIGQFSDFKNRIVVIVSHSGGVAFDTAYNHGAAKVLTGTVVRTNLKKGFKPLEEGAQRAIKAAKKQQTGITLVAASPNSYEDILAVEGLAELIIELGFLKL
ncbi:MAG: hypothetical protein R6V17_07900 [Halanaerobacter sp.]